MFAWFLWNGVGRDEFEPEPFFAFLVALVVWIATEIKHSEEIVFRQSSPNDVRVAKELLRLHAHTFRTLLNDRDLFQFLDSNHFSDSHDFCHRRNTGQLRFQNLSLDGLLEKFASDLGKLNHSIAQNTVPELIGGQFMTGFKPRTIVSQEEYDRQLALAEHANEQASVAWGSLENLVNQLHIRVPEALDEPDNYQL